MSTIVWCPPLVAADTLVCEGEGCRIGRRESKIVAVTITGVPHVIAVTGPRYALEPLRDWLAHGAHLGAMPKIPDEFDLLVMRSERTLVYRKDQPWPEEITSPHAWGTGRKYALGALDAGVGAMQAIEAACRLDPWSDFPIEVYDLKRHCWIERLAGADEAA